MIRLSRRQFLRMLAASSTAFTLQQLMSACGMKPTSGEIFPTATQRSQPSPTNPLHTSASAPPTSTPASSQLHRPALQTWWWRAAAIPKRSSGAPLAAYGGMQAFVPKDARVIIKPNICVAYHTYEYAATTNPWVVGALVKTCLEAGARSVQVLDFPFGGTPQEAYAKSGIEEQVLAAGGEMVFMPEFKFVSTKIPQGVVKENPSIR